MSAITALAGGAVSGIWKLAALALAAVLLVVAGAAGTGWRLAAGDRDLARAASRSLAASHQPVPVELATTSSTAASAIAAAFQIPPTAAPANVPSALIRCPPRS